MKQKATAKQLRRIEAPSGTHREAWLVSGDESARALCWHTVRKVAGKPTKVSHSGLDVATFLPSGSVYEGEAIPQNAHIEEVASWFLNHHDTMWPPCLEDDVLGRVALQGTVHIQTNGPPIVRLYP